MGVVINRFVVDMFVLHIFFLIYLIILLEILVRVVNCTFHCTHNYVRYCST